MKVLIGSFLFLLLILYSPLFSKDEMRPYKLIHADSLTIEKEFAEYVTYLNGNVHFFYGETEFLSNHAQIFDIQKIVHLMGKVKVIDDSLTLRADKVSYFRQKEKIELKGNVIVNEFHIDGTFKEFESGNAEYFRTERKLTALSNVKFHDSKDNLNGNCGYVNYDFESGYGFMIRKPEIFINSKDSLKITAQKIELYKNKEKIVATFNVKVFATDFHTESDFLIYMQNKDEAIFLGEPMFFSEFADASAEEIRIYMYEEKLEKAVFQDSCLVEFSIEDAQKDTTIVLEKLSWVRSHYMEFLFEEGKITKCNAETDVDAFIFQPQKGKTDFFIDKTTGQNLNLTINDNSKIETIIVWPKVKGVYKFNNKSIDK